MKNKLSKLVTARKIIKFLSIYHYLTYLFGCPSPPTPKNGSSMREEHYYVSGWMDGFQCRIVYTSPLMMIFVTFKAKYRN